MSIYTPEKAYETLEIIQDRLSEWPVSDLGQRSAIVKSKEYTDLAKSMEELVYGVQVEWRVQVKVGAAALSGYKFKAGAIDPHKALVTPLDPDFELIADRAKSLYNHRYTEHELFIGNETLYIDLLSVATTLSQGGELSLTSNYPS